MEILDLTAMGASNGWVELKAGGVEKEAKERWKEKNQKPPKMI